MEYNLDLHIAWARMDLYGKLKKLVGNQYAHRPHIKNYWVNFQDEKEVRMRHYMRMMTQFVWSINLFHVPNQIVEEEDTIIDERFNVVANLLLPLIYWDEKEVNDLDIVKWSVENRTKKWVDSQISQLKVQGAVLTYDKLEDKLKSETDSGVAISPTNEASKSPLAMTSKKRKDAPEHHPKHNVYTWKTVKGESSKKAKKLGGFVSKIPKIEEDPLREGKEEAE